MRRGKLKITCALHGRALVLPTFALATLPDIPNELLFTITHDLNNQFLFNLGLTCRRLNTIALDCFFSKNDIQGPAGGYFLPDLSKNLP
jgi:hypothetical protein